MQARSWWIGLAAIHNEDSMIDCGWRQFYDHKHIMLKRIGALNWIGRYSFLLVEVLELRPSRKDIRIDLDCRIGWTEGDRIELNLI